MELKLLKFYKSLSLLLSIILAIVLIQLTEVKTEYRMYAKFVTPQEQVASVVPKNLPMIKGLK